MKKKQYTSIICIVISLLIHFNLVKANQHNANAITGSYMNVNIEDISYNSVLVLYLRKFSPWWGISGGYMGTNIKMDYTGSKTNRNSSGETIEANNLKATININDKTYLALFDLFIFRGDLRISAGLNYNQGKYSTQANVSGNTKIGDANYDFSTGGGISTDQKISGFGRGVFGVAYDYRFDSIPLILGFQCYYYSPPKSEIKGKDIKQTDAAADIVINEEDLDKLADSLNTIYALPKVLLAFSLGYSF